MPTKKSPKPHTKVKEVLKKEKKQGKDKPKQGKGEAMGSGTWINSGARKPRG